MRYAKEIERGAAVCQRNTARSDARVELREQLRPKTESFFMSTTFAALLSDEAGFVVSAELILISTIVVIGLIVGLAEVSLNVTNELEDVGSATGQMQQGYYVAGTHGHKAWVSSSYFVDNVDLCDGEFDVDLDCDGPRNEGPGYQY